MFSRLTSISCIGLLSFSGLAYAGAIPTIGGVGINAALTFTAPTGIVGPTDIIPVFETLTLGATSAAFKTDGAGMVIGLTDADITPWLNATPGVDLATDTLRTSFNAGYGCVGQTFSTTDCIGGPPYSFTFNLAAPSFVFPKNLDVEPGGSYTFLFGSFSPTGGSAPAGTYVLPDVSAVITVSDMTLPMDPVIANIVFATTVGKPEFTRTVEATPEPGTWTMMLAGLVMAGFAMRRKSVALRG